MRNVFRSSLIAVWLGAALFFSAVVAPAAFGVLRQFNVSNANEIAGAIVSRALTVINLSGFSVSIVALAVTLWRRPVRRRAGFFLQLLSLGVLTISTAAGQWLVTARMRALRAGLTTTIDQLNVDDARRQLFSNLHHYSVVLLSVAMIAAIIALVLFGVRTQGQRDSAIDRTPK